MQLTAILLLCCCLQVAATGLSQTVSFTGRGAPLETVFSVVKEQTGYVVVYSAKRIREAKPVTLNAQNLPLEEFLDLAVRGQSLDYVIKGNTIFIRKKPSAGNNIPVENSVFEQLAPPVRGRVTDVEGSSLEGATVSVRNKSRAVTTDEQGRFTLDAEPGDVLVVTYVGYDIATYRVTTDPGDISIVLKTSEAALDDVVVVGFGIQKKVNLTGAVDVVSGDKLQNRQSPTVSQLLQGTSPGLSFDISNQFGLQPGASMDIKLRGIGSLNGGSPLFVIDGFPGSIDNLNPEDIESISVLKDASASAIYGARAPYGVILVTTKNGKRDRKLSVSYSGNMGISSAQNLPKSLDSYTWSRIQNEAGDNRGGRPISNETIDRIIAYQNQDYDFLNTFMPEGVLHYGAYPIGNLWDGSNLNYANTDWWDIYYGHSLNTKQDIAVHGGGKNISYYFSGGMYRQNGVLNFGKDVFTRKNLMGKINVAIARWMDFNWESRLSHSDREFPTMGQGEDYFTLFLHVSRAYPFTPVYDGWGNYLWESHIPRIQDGGTDRSVNLDTWNNFKTEIRPLKGWKIHVDFAYNYLAGVRTDNQKEVYFYNVDKSSSVAGPTIPNHIERVHTNNAYWTSNIYSSYDFELKDHRFHILAGSQLEKGRNYLLSSFKSDLINSDVPSLQTATGNAIVYENLSERATAGYFARLMYNYDDRYLLEGNVRHDGSYVFRSGNRWGTFPSFSAGWNLHNEAFWQVQKAVNTLKIRGSWGQLGNQQVAPFSDLELMMLQTGRLDWIYGYGSRRPIGYTSAPNLVNRNLTWETATMTNFGLNTSFLNNRLMLDFDIYERNTRNMIGPAEALPGVLGENVPMANNATLRTRGWEMGLKWNHTISDKLSYYIQFNLYDYKSVVTKYNNPTGTLSTWYEGAEVGEIWGFQVNDLFRTQTELDDYLSKTDLSYFASNWNTGDVRYEDINNDGRVNNGNYTIHNHGDLMKIGNSNPRYQYGSSIGISYKGFDLSMLWRGVFKRDVYFSRVSNLFWGFNDAWFISTLTPDHLDYYRDRPGDKYVGLYEGEANINLDAYWPRPYLSFPDESKNKDHANTRYLQNASYLRLQNVQLAYNLPKNVSARLKLQNVRFFISGENLLTFSRFPRGMDPVATREFGRLTYGADRVVSFGLNVLY